MAKSGWIQTLQSKPDKNVKQQFILNIRLDKVKSLKQRVRGKPIKKSMTNKPLTN